MKEKRIDLDEYNQIVDAYHEESDRGAAVLAAAYLHDLVKQVVRQQLVKDSIVDVLFEGIGPLATFDACARLAYGMRLVSTEIYHDTLLIRRVRNAFAHTRTALTFRDPTVADRCRELSTAKFFEKVIPEEPHYKDPRFWYLFAVAGATIAITAAGRGHKVQWLGQGPLPSDDTRGQVASTS